MDLDDAARQLYSLPPQEFTAERDRLAREARGEDRALAERIHALRRPSLAAWALNQFARERVDELAALLDLGEQLRAAQESLDAGELRALAAHRRDVVSAILGEIRRLANDRGHPLSDQVVGEVGQTLDAALAGAGAADEVRAGQLTAALHHVGFGAAVQAGEPPEAAPGGAAAMPAGGRRAAEGRGGGGGSGDRSGRRNGEASRSETGAERAGERQRARRKAAEQQRDEAGAELARRRSELDRASGDAERADAEDERARQEVEEIEEHLDTARRAAAEAGRRRRDAHATLRSAEQHAAAAAERLERAARAIEELGPPAP